MAKFRGLTIKEITEVNDINCIGDRIVWNDDGHTFRKDIVGFVTYTGLDDNDNKIIFEDSEGKTWTHIGYVPNEINFVVDGKYACEFIDVNGAHQRIICNFNGVCFVELYGHCPRSFHERYFSKITLLQNSTGIMDLEESAIYKCKAASKHRYDEFYCQYNGDYKFSDLVDNEFNINDFDFIEKVEEPKELFWYMRLAVKRMIG